MSMDHWQPQEFAAHLLAPDATPPASLTSWTGHNSSKRFNVYRNNVRGALVEALAVRYPVVQRLVGEEFFRVMAAEFAVANLPPSPLLIHYGAEFPEHIAAFEPAAELPYLPDVARLESAYWQAYHAVDDTPLTAEAFQVIAPERLAEIRLEFIAGCHVLQSQHPIVSIWQTNAVDTEVTPVDLSLREDALVSRPHLSVEVRTLPQGAAHFLRLLQQGEALGEAAQQSITLFPAFDLTANLAGLIQTGIVKDIHS